MLHAQKYILENGLQALTDDLGIKVRKDGNLLTLNYCQINSPKTHPVVMECRALTLEDESFRIVSRGMDRFFNLGEALNVMPEIDWDKAEVYEKMDGSFIKIFKHEGSWVIATRGVAGADVECMGYNITFRELVYRALNVADDEAFQKLMNVSYLFPACTYMFELTCLENRVVTRYEGCKLTFLASRENISGNYFTEEDREWFQSPDCLLKGLVGHPRSYSFTSEQNCRDAVRELPNLEEGYVLYQDGVPVAKVKSPQYVAVHHIRGEGLNPKRAMELVLSGEIDEYLTYFEDDRWHLKPYINAYDNLVILMDIAYDAAKHIEDQKEFANAIKKHDFKACLFGARRDNVTPYEFFTRQRITSKIQMLEKFV